MKNFTFLIGLFILISCSQSKEELLISDYEQTIGNTKTNLNLKFNKFEFIKDITWKDSLELLTVYFKEKKEKKIEQFEILKNSDIDDLESYKVYLKKEKYNSNKVMLKEYIDEREKSIQGYNESIELYNGDCKGTFLEDVYSKINNPNLNGDSILSKVYDVVYTIKNPLLNNVEQTISKTYYLNSDLTKILKVSSDSIK